MPTKPTTPKIRWSQDLRRSLYSTLVTLFGPHDSWIEANPSGLDEFCATFARRHGAANGGAVRLQMTYATTQPKARRYKVAEYYALNKAAAIETGFLTRSAAWPSGFSAPFDPIACETLLHGFYAELPHGGDEQAVHLQRFVDAGFKHGMEYDAFDRNRLSVAAEGLLRLALVLHERQLEMEHVAVGPDKYDNTLLVIDEVRQGFERLKHRLPKAWF